MEWNDRFDLAVDAMNDQHEQLINLMNQLHDLHEAKASFAERQPDDGCFTFLKLWLTSHIMGIDKQYSPSPVVGH